MSTEKYVFISYSSKDIVFVNKIVTILERMGVSYWKAPDMIPAGSNYAREIPNAILGCEVFLLVLSSTSQESIWVEKEIDSAIRKRKTVIPVQIDRAPMSEMFLFYLNNVQMISYSEDPENAIAELKYQLRTLLSDKMETNKKWNSNSKENERSTVLQAKGAKALVEEEVSRRNDKGVGGDRKNLDGDSFALRAKRMNAFSVNRIPTECRYCKGELTQMEMGIYRCNEYGKDNYDDFSGALV